ncbi:polyamine-transporting ATPase 13A3-like, partial [Saccoglossus kowalevskii]
PDNFHDVLINYTQQGLRVIALAWKPLHPSVQWHKALKMPRVEVECDLQFLGLLIMQNKLKPETTPVIKELTNAQIRLIMVTGDNILTAICVARECGLLPVNDEVIMIDARPPDEDKYENITWKYVDKRSGPNNEEDLVKPK